MHFILRLIYLRRLTLTDCNILPKKNCKSLKFKVIKTPLKYFLFTCAPITALLFLYVNFDYRTSINFMNNTRKRKKERKTKRREGRLVDILVIKEILNFLCAYMQSEIFNATNYIRNIMNSCIRFPCVLTTSVC